MITEILKYIVLLTPNRQYLQGDTNCIYIPLLLNYLYILV